MGQRPGEASMKRRNKSCDSRGKEFIGRVGRGLQSLLNGNVLGVCGVEAKRLASLERDSMT